VGLLDADNAIIGKIITTIWVKNILINPRRRDIKVTGYPGIDRR
jgi:hypothetical protein